jgi:uncharacterized small protein (DUF1192 family)
MDWDEVRAKPGRTITVGESLDNVSLAELEARVAALAAEIERVKAEIAKKRAHEAAAAAIFKR